VGEALGTSTGWTGWSTGDAVVIADGVAADAGRDGGGAFPQAATSAHTANTLAKRLINRIMMSTSRATTDLTPAWFPRAAVAARALEHPFHLV